MKIIQAGDFHLDQPFADWPPDVGERRRREQMSSVTALLDLVAEERADALVLTGDIFEAATTRPRTVLTFAEALQRVAPTPVLIAPGNHDPYGERAFWAAPFPPHVHVFGPAWKRVEIGDIAFWGKAFAPADALRDPMESFPGEKHPHIVILHADLVPQSHRSAYAPVHREDFADPALLHAALGHIHKPGEAAVRTWYAGSLEPIGFDEPGPHGCLVVEISQGEPTVAFRPLAQRTYETREIDVSTLVRGSEDEAVSRATEGLDPARVLLRLRLIGERQAVSPDAADIGEAGRRAGFACQTSDATRLAPPAEADAMTLRGIFITAMEAAMQGAASDHEREVARRALEDGLAALEGRKIIDL